MAGLATHQSAEPDTLVVRVDFDERELLLEDAPETYYVTDYYRKYPLVLVRLSRVGVLRREPFGGATDGDGPERPDRECLLLVSAETHRQCTLRSIQSRNGQDDARHGAGTEGAFSLSRLARTNM